MMPPDAAQVVADADATLFGAVGSPDVPDAITAWGLILSLRQQLELYLNLRPVRAVPGAAGDGFAMLIVRENTEGEYVGTGGRLYAGTDAETATHTSVFTRRGIERAVEYAFRGRARGRPAHQRDEVERVAAHHGPLGRGHRGGRRPPPRHPLGAHARRRGRLPDGPRTRAVRRARRVQPVRRHPQRPRRGAAGHARARGQRQRQPGRPASASSSRSTAARRTSRAAAWPTRSGRSTRRPCCSTTSARADAAELVRAAVDATLSAGSATADSAAPARPRRWATPCCPSAWPVMDGAASVVRGGGGALDLLAPPPSPARRTRRPARCRAARSGRRGTRAATTWPPSYTGALTEAMPAARSPTLCTQPARSASSSPSSSRPGRALLHREQRADRHHGAQLRRRLDRQDDQPLLAPPHEQLAALAGVGRQLFEDGGRDLREARRGETAAGDEEASFIPAQEAVHLERGDESMGGGPRVADGLVERLESDRLVVLDQVEQEHRLVEHADAAHQVVHGSEFSARREIGSREAVSAATARHRALFGRDDLVGATRRRAGWPDPPFPPPISWPRFRRSNGWPRSRCATCAGCRRTT